MLPSTWWRRALVIIGMVALSAGCMELALLVAPAGAWDAAQTVSGIVFLVLFYAAMPWVASFLVPHASADVVLQARVSAVVGSLPPMPAVLLYDHDKADASAVGLVPGHSRIYISTALARQLSDLGLAGVLAHEMGHLQGRHILATLGWACAFIGVWALLPEWMDGAGWLIAGYLGFMALRRQLEYRADRCGATFAGAGAMLSGLRELKGIFTEKDGGGWQIWVRSYPTLSSRISAIEARFGSSGSTRTTREV